MGRDEEARGNYKKYLKLLDGKRLEERADALLLLGRLEEALECLKLTTTESKTNVRAWNDLGGLLQKMGRAEEARSAYQRAASLGHKVSFR